VIWQEFRYRPIRTNVHFQDAEGMLPVCEDCSKMEYRFCCHSPLGPVTVSSDGASITGLRFSEPGELSGSGEPRLPVFRETVRWLDCYFGGRDPGFLPPVLLNTTEFRRAVYGLLLRVPFGATVSYGELAESLAGFRGVPRISAQAVGGALAHNPVLLIIPCHRVIGRDGRLTGYAGGLSRKTRLLALEQRECTLLRDGRSLSGES